MLVKFNNSVTRPALESWDAQKVKRYYNEKTNFDANIHHSVLGVLFLRECSLYLMGGNCGTPIFGLYDADFFIISEFGCVDTLEHPIRCDKYF